MKQISAKELKRKIENEQIVVANVIDVRSTIERLMKKITGSTHIPMSKIVTTAGDRLDKSQTYYIVCASGVRSSASASELEKLGYKVVNVTGGMAQY